MRPKDPSSDAAVIDVSTPSRTSRGQAVGVALEGGRALGVGEDDPLAPVAQPVDEGVEFGAGGGAVGALEEAGHGPPPSRTACTWAGRDRRAGSTRSRRPRAPRARRALRPGPRASGRPSRRPRWARRSSDGRCAAWRSSSASLPRLRRGRARAPPRAWPGRRRSRAAGDSEGRSPAGDVGRALARRGVRRAQARPATGRRATWPLRSLSWSRAFVMSTTSATRSSDSR